MNLPGKLQSLTSALKERKQVRKDLRGPAHLYYAIADAIDMLDRSAWEQLTAGSGFFMSADYLQALEPVLPLNLSPRYALVYSGDAQQRRPLAAIYMQVADISLAQLRPEKQRGARIDALARSTTQRILTCGNLLTYGQHGIAIAPDGDPRQAWHGVAEVLYRIRQSDKLEGKTHFIMINDLHSHHRSEAAHLEHLSYRYVETEPNMVLALDPLWKTYDDYLASLAAKYRANVRNAIFKKMD